MCAFEKLFSLLCIRCNKFAFFFSGSLQIGECFLRGRALQRMEQARRQYEGFQLSQNFNLCFIILVLVLIFMPLLLLLFLVVCLSFGLCTSFVVGRLGYVRCCDGSNGTTPFTVAIHHTFSGSNKNHIRSY